MTKYKKWVLDKMLEDPQLYALLAEMLKIEPGSVKGAVFRNSKKLYDYKVVTGVANYFGEKPENILEEVAEAA